MVVGTLVAFVLMLFEEEPLAQDPSLAAWSAAVGFVLPLAIAVLNQTHWPSRWKALAAFGVCFAAALVTAYLDGTFDVGHVLQSLLIVFTVARATYAGLWRPIGVAHEIEQKTTVTAPPPP